MIETIPGLLEAAAAETPDKACLFHGENSLTFAQLRREARGAALALRRLGIRKGDRVGVLMQKNLRQVSALLGVLYAEAVLVPILHKLKRNQILHIVQDCGMTALIADASRLPAAAGIAPGLTVIAGDGAAASQPHLPELSADLMDAPLPYAGAAADNAAIIYSSGSTGRPKGILLPHRGLVDGARITSTYLGTRREDRISGNLGLTFDYGLNQLWQTLFKKASLHLMEPILPGDLFRQLSAERLTVLPLMPAMITHLFDPRLHRLDGGRDFSAVRTVTVTGGRVSRQMLTHLQTAFAQAQIFLMYGLTEAFRSTFLPPGQVSRRSTSMGKAIPEVEIYVLDENGRVCPPGVPGELVHRGKCIAKGYWNDPVQTAGRFREIPLFPGETVVFSGDLVQTDAEGFLYFIGRKDSMIKTQGYRVSPTEIEAEADQHARIQASVAFGVDNIEIGEDIALAYITGDGAPVDAPELIRFLKPRLPAYMVPRHLVHLEDFPCTANDGKIDRLEVRALAAKQLSAPTSRGGGLLTPGKAF
ncbi:MAG: AMP-binding protein [Nitrospinaceae bacterium]